MLSYYGSCNHCSFVYSVNDRFPVYCPECGEPLYHKRSITFDLPRMRELKGQCINSDDVHVSAAKREMNETDSETKG